MSELNVEVVQMTPEMAAGILSDQAILVTENGLIQRRVDRGRVGQYAREMASGNWLLNGETIQFNGSKLLNGQHRLRAVVESKTTVQMLVVRGVDENAFTTLDTGKSRSVNNVLQTLNLTYRYEVGGGARWALSYERNGYPRSPALEDRVTTREVVAYIHEHQEDLIEAAAIAARMDLSARNALTALFFLGRNRPERERFAKDLRDGVNLGKYDAVRLLRDRLIAQKGAKAKLAPAYVFALCLKAWNARIRDQALGILRFSKDEDYPVMIR